MKKLTVIMLVLLLLTMTGCGSDNGTESDVKVENEENKESTTETVESSETEFNTNVSIEETVIYDQDGVTITATDLTTDLDVGLGEAVLSLRIDNNSDEDWRIFSTSYGYEGNVINGITVGFGFLDVNVRSGVSRDVSISFLCSTLEETFGIYSIKEIQLEIGRRYSDYSVEILDIAPIYTNLH